jgi:hypothetical protein
VPEEYHFKMHIYDVGKDKWFSPFHRKLIEILSGMAIQHGLFLK